MKARQIVMARLGIYRHQPATPWWPPFSDRLEFAAEKYLGKWQQPVREAEYLLSNLCPQNGVVLDPACGTGTAAEACLRLGLSFIGGDIDPEMVHIARCRIAGASSNAGAA
jgi:adenine-specific DNA-methyltransferase